MNKPEKPILCYVTDRLSLPAPPRVDAIATLLAHIQIATRAGIDWIQLREKDLDTRALLDLTIAAIRDTHNARDASACAAKVIVNDRLDVAWAADAAGVHLGESSIPAGIVTRQKLNTDKRTIMVGASCHSLEDATQAATNGCDYICFGPVFATPSKLAFGAPQGVSRLRQVCQSVSIPVLAIGGISIENIAACMDAGASGIAAIRLFQQAADLPSSIEQLSIRAKS